MMDLMLKYYFKMWVGLHRLRKPAAYVLVFSLYMLLMHLIFGLTW